MPQFNVNPQRFDPYKNFKFRVKWDGKYVAGLSKMSALKRTTEPIKHREGGDPSTSRKSPGRTEYEAITLERGVTHDLEFEKWAAAEVSDFDSIPENMEPYVLQGGLYAVFMHKGAASTGFKTFQFIFGTWLPQSEYELDNREHFEILGEKYKNEDPDSEEEIWIPIKHK
jgi:predicted transcriptional regulator YdeE